MRPRPSTLAVWGVGLVLAYGLMSARTAPSPDWLWGDLPVLSGGRVKPLDSVARHSLLVLSGKQSVRMNGRPVGAAVWLKEMVFQPDVADTYPVFEIDDPDVLGSIGMASGRQRRYRFLDLQPHLSELQTQSERAGAVRPELRSRFQKALLRLWEQVLLYWRIQNTLRLTGPDSDLPGVTGSVHEIEAYQTALNERGEGTAARPVADMNSVLSAFQARYQTLADRAEFRVLPAGAPDRWASLGQGLLDGSDGSPLHPAIGFYARMGDACRSGDTAAFRQALFDYRDWLGEHVPGASAQGRREGLFNRYQAFYKSLVLYVIVCGLVFLSFLRWPAELRRTAYGILVLAFIVHTGGLVARMILQGRPPVTNLYSSAIFVGWGSVLLGVVVERMFKNGWGSLGSAAIGFLTQIIALHLAAQGDTMEMMRAVLDSNFWLATHVVTVTAGYSATFLSGVLGVVFILRGVFSKGLEEEAAQNLTRMVYGIVCFSAFFSFIGTVLGGIWADQSWGRFWGWDPKENGALMIVLWNALILHMGWDKQVGRRGLMNLAVFGNIITALSWFGVNMLGIGLHSYGFMDKASLWLIVFCLSQAAIIGLGALPARFWGSPGTVS
ncbi:MAG: cytochrome c biogenesis protein CcsA [Elusimicrobia bacterium]|nr:cytochrome c biogenesis protein CcsA [Elusimicrobiota bacterium]